MVDRRDREQETLRSSGRPRYREDVARPKTDRHLDRNPPAEWRDLLFEAKSGGQSMRSPLQPQRLWESLFVCLELK